jgi:hypothetical protein
LKNGFTPQSVLVELAALEQLTHPSLESNDANVAIFRKAAEHRLNQVTRSALQAKERL